MRATPEQIDRGFMDLRTALETVLVMAQKHAETNYQAVACSVVEDHIVNTEWEDDDGIL